MKHITLVLINISFTLQFLSVLGLSQAFDFFYFVQRWPGSCCDTTVGCCFPSSGKPASDFLIHGLWPYDKSGSPSQCDPGTFRSSELSDLMRRIERNWPAIDCPSNPYKFWMGEWENHGTCSQSFLNQHDYFERALDLKDRFDFLNILQRRGINPNGSSYSLESIKDATRIGIGYTPWIECNTDSSNKSQLYQIYVCVEKSGSRPIECPVFPSVGVCASQILFPAF